ncbi:sigma-70 family RNA polymerase sigma factor [Streptomyces decoyicus]|uniref:Sigma-70 family RNA polymerase sigma factor n=1 Tax=Streptomyces decoyicus TaxID=249567 RepID=A0ABZ1FLG9_9ACTN|nr:sigma-70 family RNA polymerase sigma factor [Streptomyces decoyicus]WSB70418.1 sigma-70 family RNA polymerase sigma factor [Streptomyces decoyicus]
MGVDGRDGRRDGEAGVEERAGTPSGQAPGRTESAAERHDRAGEPAGEGHSVPPQRDRSRRRTAPAADPEGGELPPSDAQLLADLRAGDDSAYEEMYRRHADAVRRYARSCCRDAHTAEDLTGEVFARTLQAVRGGAGPDSAVRAYLLTTVRRVAASWAKTARREQLVEDFAVFAVSAAGAPGDRDTVDLGADVRALHEAEQSMAVQAFRSLPERYQTVLWHTAVEDESPSEVAPLLGLTANATAVLAHRAREGLKQAYLQAHVSQSLTAGGDCARYADRLGAYARGGLRMRAERGLRKHLDACGRCRLAALEVEDVNQRIGALLPVAVIGWFAAGYAVKAAAAAAGVAGAGAAAGAGVAAGVAGGGGSGAAAGGSGGAAAGKGLGAAVKVGIGVGATVVAGAALALALTGSPEPAPAPHAQPAQPRPSAPQQPAPEPSRSALPPAAGAAPAPPKQTANPHPSSPPTRKPRPEPTPAPPRAPQRPAPGSPAPSTPVPRPTPPKPSPKPPLPAPTAYRLNALDHDFMGDSSRPEVRTLGSSWLWQRQEPEIAGTTYAHGVSVHARSSVTVDLNRRCTAYDAVAGIDDLSLGRGAVRFSVYADGVRLWQSAVVRGGERAVPVHVPLAGRRTLRLVAEPASPVGSVALGDWAQSTISCR